MATSKSSKSKAAWDRARRYAQEHGVTVKEARSLFAKGAAEPTPLKPARKTREKSTAGIKSKAVDLAAAEAQLRKKYPHIVAGSIQAHEDGAHRGRRTVEIVCQAKGCKNRRRIHTSDAFQVQLCTDCTKLYRAQKRTTINKKGTK